MLTRGNLRWVLVIVIIPASLGSRDCDSHAWLAITIVCCSLSQVVDNDRPEGSKFRILGKGVEQEPKGFFKIIEGTGEVFVTQQLDREAIATYEVNNPGLCLFY